MKKRFLPLALTLALAFSLAVPAFAANDVTISTDTNGDNIPDTCYVIPDVLDTKTYQGVLRDTDDMEASWAFGTDPEHVTVYTVKTGVKIDVSGHLSANAIDLELSDGKLLIRDSVTDWSQVWKLVGEFVPVYPDEPDWTMFGDGSYIEFIKEGLYAFTVNPDSPMYLRDKCVCVLYVSDDGSAPAAPTAAPIAAPIVLDARAETLMGYLFHNDTTYVMLRDVAKLLSGTEAQFEVSWDAERGIALTTGKPYTPVGGEQVSKGADPKPYTAGTNAITIDGKAVTLEGYAIEGNNYFKLRDLGKALGFHVSWSTEQGIGVDTSRPYSDAG